MWTQLPTPDGTPLFKKGFKDGCGAVVSARATGFYRSKYKFNYDSDLIDNPEYNFGHTRGYSYCFEHTVGSGHTLGGSADTYILGGDKRKIIPFSMGKGSWNHSINEGGNTWNTGLGTSGSINDIFGIVQKGKGGSAFGSHPLWGTWHNGQIFGQSYGGTTWGK